MQRFEIQGRLPGLNEYTRACRGNKYVGARMKADAEAVVAGAIRAAKLRPMRGPVILQYIWHEPDMRRDADNVQFAQKFIQDALVRTGILAGDGRKEVVGSSHVVDVGRPGVTVSLIEVVTERQDASEGACPSAPQRGLTFANRKATL